MTPTTRGKVITLENFIIDTFTRVDEITGEEHKVDQEDQIGGGGTYAIIGARMFIPATRLGMIIHYTPSSLPGAMKDLLLHYGSDIWEFKERVDGHPTIKAVNRYKGQLRIFEYLTEPLHSTPLSILGTRLMALPLPEIIHSITFPNLIHQFVKEIPELAHQAGEKDWNPKLIWEPEPDACVPKYLEDFKAIVPYLDVVSPNHMEALSLFSLTPTRSLNDAEMREQITKVCRMLHSFKPKLATIIRSGHLGSCHIVTPSAKSQPSSVIRELEQEGAEEDAKIQDRELEVHWVPAYWSPGVEGYEGKVIDPTGAGNSFMGGLCAALDSGLDVLEGSIWGSVAASFTIEQDGLPVLSNSRGYERWNNDEPARRVNLLKHRMGLSSS